MARFLSIELNFLSSTWNLLLRMGNCVDDRAQDTGMERTSKQKNNPKVEKAEPQTLAKVEARDL